MNTSLQRTDAAAAALASATSAKGGNLANALPFRIAPHNIEAEQALLGAILINNEAQDRVSSFLEPKHFFDPLHAQIYETLGKLIHSGKQVVHTLHERRRHV